jgi:uncharacterized protein with PQ loop repeat
MKQKLINPKLMKLISTITFWSGIALCAYAVFALIMEGSASGRDLGSKPVMIASVILLLASFVTSFFTGRKGTKSEEEER